MIFEFVDGWGKKICAFQVFRDDEFDDFLRFRKGYGDYNINSIYIDNIFNSDDDKYIIVLEKVRKINNIR